MANYIFVASQDVSPGGYTIVKSLYLSNGYDGTVCRINSTSGSIIVETFTWRPCSDGLSLADTDNDGVFALYQVTEICTMVTAIMVRVSGFGRQKTWR
ncbi:MAG: hypothetical protein GX799_05780 [Crenarchaeota archaeon]|nr:hypothetical protein [Thermoproteota archaeon]